MQTKEWIRKYIAGFIYLVFGILVLVGIVMGAFIYMTPPCLEKEALAKARSLSDTELEKIYSEATILLNDKLITSYQLESLPPKISALQPVGSTSHGSSLWLYLATCGFDNKVIVFIDTSEKFEQGIRVSGVTLVSQRFCGKSLTKTSKTALRARTAASYARVSTLCKRLKTAWGRQRTYSTVDTT